MPPHLPTLRARKPKKKTNNNANNDTSYSVNTTATASNAANSSATFPSAPAIAAATIPIPPAVEAPPQQTDDSFSVPEPRIRPEKRKADIDLKEGNQPKRRAPGTNAHETTITTTTTTTTTPAATTRTRRKRPGRPAKSNEPQLPRRRAAQQSSIAATDFTFNVPTPLPVPGAPGVTAQSADTATNNVPTAPPETAQPNTNSNNNREPRLNRNKARHRTDKIYEPDRHRLPPPKPCRHCGALRWDSEPKGLCCGNGKVVLPSLPPAPEPLASLLSGQDSISKEFRKKIRAYNQVFSFVSMGVNLDQSLANGKEGVYTFRIHGGIYHRIGSLLPEEGNPAKFLQIYVHDTDHELQNRLNAIPANLNPEVTARLQEMVHSRNPYAQQFKHLAENHQPTDDLQFRINTNKVPDPRRYNAPTASEVAAIWVNADGKQQVGQDIIVQCKGGPLKRIPYYCGSLDALKYPLIHVNGESGWRIGIPYRNGVHLDANAAANGGGIDAHENQVMIEEPGAGNDDAEADVGNGEREDVVGVAVEGNDEGAAKSKCVTLREYYAYHLQIRTDTDILRRSGRLYQEFVVNGYVKVESSRLSFIRANQKELRAADYAGIVDAVNSSDGPINGNAIGTSSILPSSFSAGPRYLMQKYQDSMAIVREFGKPDIFITMTCNPNWPEVLELLEQGQQPCDRPDIVARVFKQKMDVLLHDLTEKSFLGKVAAYFWVVEFQKRGLPHLHLLLTLESQDKPRSPDDYDSIVSAEVPNPELYPKAHETVMKTMIHSHGDKCLKGGNVCTLGYPKPYVEATSSSKSSYPLYRRRDDGKTYSVKTGNQTTIRTNRDIVPHNRYFSAKFNCHINVEIASTIKAVKYVYKYLTKGNDCASFEVTAAGVGGGDGVGAAAAAGGGVGVGGESNGNQAAGVNQAEAAPNVGRDEIKEYVDGRYISASEAVWRLFRFPICGQSPNVIRLAVHLPDKHLVTFQANEPVEQVLENPKNEKTMLTAFFDLNKDSHPHHELARQLHYHQIPKHFTWDANKREWKKRVYNSKSIGRMYVASPKDQERYFLRLLLCHVKGVTSWDDLLTVNDHVCTTFRESAKRRGLLEDDADCVATMEDAAVSSMPDALRQLFVILLLETQVGDAKQLWDRFKEDMSEDYLHQAREVSRNPELEISDILIRQSLKDINRRLQQHGKSLRDFPELPQLSEAELAGEHGLNNIVLVESSHTVSQQDLDKINYLNDAQRAVFDAVRNRMELNQGGLFFVDGPGGSGKTFMYTALLAYVRGVQNKIALATASSGIAALLLPGGRTAHSRFKIPIVVTADSVCSITKESADAALLRQTALIIWDEAPMQHKHCFEALDRTLRDIMDTPAIPFGGKIVVLGGDFRQIPPVIKKGTRAQIVSASLRHATFWESVQRFRLTTNMRIQRDGDAGNDDANVNANENENDDTQDFARFLLAVGDGIAQGKSGDETSLRIPEDMILHGSLHDLINWTYPDLHANYKNHDYITDRAILTPRNSDADEINAKILTTFPGDEVVYQSIDKVCDEKDTVTFPTEFLNSLTPPGLPPHELRLKIGACIMLLRNIDPPGGCCNGTRLIVTRLSRNAIEAIIVTGSHVGRTVFLPKLPLISSEDASIPFALRRFQFPIRLAFALTINKSQGQTIPNVVLFLREPCFAHGQLYVAFSRVKSRKNIKVLVGDGSSNKDDATTTTANNDDNTVTTTKRQNKKHIYTSNIVYKELLLPK